MKTRAKKIITAKTIWQRFTIIFAGPFFNLVLCFLLLWLVFFIGIQRPLILSIAYDRQTFTEICCFSKRFKKRRSFSMAKL